MFGVEDIRDAATGEKGERLEGNEANCATGAQYMSPIRVAILLDLGSHLEYSVGLDYGRAIESAGAQVVKLIPYKTIYREFGPTVSPRSEK